MDKDINFYGRANRVLIEHALQQGALKDCQIAECDLCNLQVSDAVWNNVHVRDLHANDAGFNNSTLEKSVFFRSSFIRASFDRTVWSSMVFDDFTLIKSRWNVCCLTDTAMKNLSLQRSVFYGSRFISSMFLDFEALDVKMDNCIFAHCTISINYGSGMNGFSNAEISNCIFYNCRFEGYPLRGSGVKSCVFAYCAGQIGDDMECNNTAGIGLKGRANRKSVVNQIEGQRLIETFGGNA